MTSMRTVTPQTIRMTNQGMAFHGGLAVRHVEKHHDARQHEADGADVGGHEEQPLGEELLHAGKRRDNDQGDQGDDADQGDPLVLVEGLGLRGDRR